MMSPEDIAYYNKTVDDTSDRLEKQCETWNREVEQMKEMPEEIVQKIQSVIGKSQLLRTSKFKQFRGFLQDATNSSIGKPVLLDDIRGFWETITLQVEDVEKTFRDLESLKKNNFVVEEQNITVTDSACAKKVASKKQTAALGRKPATASSNLKNFISAQRERKKLDGLEDEVNIIEAVPVASNGHS